MKTRMTSVWVILAALLSIFQFASAQPFAFSVNTFTTDFASIPILSQGNPIALGNLVQVILPGPNQVIDTPISSGTQRGAVGGDDVLSTTFFIGDGCDLTGLFSATLTGWPSLTGAMPNSLIQGHSFYLRVWIGQNNTVVSQIPVPAAAIYAQTALLVVPAMGVDLLNVQVTPTSANPSWQIIDEMNIVHEREGSLLPKATSITARPNPFNPTTTISYNLVSAGTVTILVYDVKGREVTALISREFQSAGRHQLNWNAAHLPTGIYLLRLTSGSQQVFEKAILMK